eukprot:m.385866 g.385866  ORF g.385866 m.385866 type:complete len:138 (-) comp16743_c0_seq22:593-1006(-)
MWYRGPLMTSQHSANCTDCSKGAKSSMTVNNSAGYGGAHPSRGGEDQSARHPFSTTADRCRQARPRHLETISVHIGRSIRLGPFKASLGRDAASKHATIGWFDTFWTEFSSVRLDLFIWKRLGEIEDRSSVSFESAD